MFLLLPACVHVVDVSIAGATIAPTTANGTPWDGPDNMPAGTMDQLRALLSHADPSGQLGDAAVGLAGAAAKPDPGGNAILLNDGHPSTIVALAEVNDTFTPTWSGATFRAVSLDGKLGVRLQLSDKDLSSDDAICLVDLTNAELTAAFATKGPHAVDTAARTSGQLLSVQVEVVKAR